MSPAPRVGAILFFTVLAATLAVAALVVRARTPDLVLEVVELAPRELRVDGEDREQVRIRFFVRESDPAAEVTIISWTGRVVRTLAAAVPLEAREQVSYTWDGRSDGGSPVMAGSYRLHVALPDSGREMAWPRRISIERPPRGLRSAPEARP